MEERANVRRWPLRRSRRADLSALAIIALVLSGGFVAGYSWLYSSLYSPAAFVKNYIGMISHGHAADALALAGVSVDSAALDDAGIAGDASDALLRGAVVRPLADLQVVSDVATDGVHEITVSYAVAGTSGTTTYRIAPDGWTGIIPRWRFEQTPLGAIELSVPGSTEFAVNGFTLDKRQVLPGGDEADLTAPVSLLVFTPNLYAIDVDTATATSPGVGVLSDVPLKNVPVTVTPQATEKLTEAVQTSVDAFLASCATQTVLQPTGCPYGYTPRGRVSQDATWSIVSSPDVDVVLDGDQWTFPSTPGIAHIQVEERSLYDGTTTETSADVHFVISGHIAMLADGRVSIRIDGVDPN